MNNKRQNHLNQGLIHHQEYQRKLKMKEINIAPLVKKDKHSLGKSKKLFKNLTIQNNPDKE